MRRWHWIICLSLSLSCWADVPKEVSVSEITISYPKTGVIDSEFSVSETKKVRFSQGNLQFCATKGVHNCADGTQQAGTYRFALNQYDRVGGEDCGEVVEETLVSDNAKRAADYGGWIDLFYFASSGYNGHNPWTRMYHSNMDITGSRSYYDWGVYNAISNGGNEPGLWRVLTDAEWRYLIGQRGNAEDKIGYASINGIHGVVLLPDSWTTPIDCSFTSGHANGFSTNIYDPGTWAKMENAGAVFLPCAGSYEEAFYCEYINDFGSYWKANTTGLFYTFAFSASGGGFNTGSKQDAGYSVRLVQDVTIPYDAPTNDDCFPMQVTIDSTFAGTIDYTFSDCQFQLSARANEAYTFYEWENHNPYSNRIVDNKLSCYYASFARAYTAQFIVDENKPSPFSPITGWVYEEPVPTVEDGYMYQGWTTEKGSSIPNVTYPYFPTKNITLYAVITEGLHVLEWKTNSVTIRYTGSSGYASIRTTNTSPVQLKLSDYRLSEYVFELPIDASALISDRDQQLIVHFINGYGQTTERRTIRIPYIVANNSCSDTMSLTESDVVILKRATLTIPNGELQLGKLQIYGGGKVVVDQEAKLEVNRIVMASGAIINNKYQYTYPQIVVNGTLTSANNQIAYDYLLNTDQYYNLAIPIATKIADISFADGHRATINEDYIIASYDGTVRASGKSGWKVIPNGTQQLEAGNGYIITARPQSFRYGGTGENRMLAYDVLRLSMPIPTDFTEEIKLIQVKPYPAAKDNNAGWNLISNPYLADYTGAVSGWGTNIEGIGRLVNDGNGGYIWKGTQRYVVIPSNDGKNYSNVLAANTNLPAFKNFFVQIGEGDAISLPLANRAQHIAAYPSIQSTEQDTMVGLVITELQDTSHHDNMGVLVGKAYSEQYEINADLQKWLNEGLNIYALSQQIDCELAFIAISETAAQFVSIGYIAPKAGTYTIALDSQFDYNLWSEIILYDSETKETTNLLLSDYVFTTNKEKNNSRFILSMTKVSDAATENKSIFANPNEQTIYDIWGRRVNSNQCERGQLYIQSGKKFVY